MKRIGMAVTVVVVLLFGRTTYAWEYVWLTDYNDQARVGCTTHNNVYAAWVCWINGMGDSGWIQLDTSCDLDHNLEIGGDDTYPDGDGWADTIYMERTATGESDYCSGSWWPLNHDGYFVILYAGDDVFSNTLSSDASVDDTLLYGDGGDDYLYQYSGAVGYADGGDGDDVVKGMGAAVGTERLYGGNGNNDCLEDKSGAWTTFNCGAGNSDDYALHGGSHGNTTGCEGTARTSCPGI